MSEAPRGAREWNARSYDRVGDSLTARGIAVVERFEVSGDERALDAGCGTGRVTAALRERLPRGRVTGIDGSAAMVAEANRLHGGDTGMNFVQADLRAELPFEDGAFDALLSTSTLHWVPDHAAVFHRFARVLADGGQLEIDCGGEGNIARVESALHAAGVTWTPWNFRGPATTTAALEAAGFIHIRTWLSPHPVHVSPGERAEYLRTVVLGSHLDRLPKDRGDALVNTVVAAIPDGVIDYVRLNISAVRRPRSHSDPKR